MKVPVLKKSLCGCRLRIGSICGAYAYLMVCLLLVCFYLFMMINSVDYVLKAILFDFIVVIFQLAATVLLLVGIYKKNRNYISKWIVVSVIVGIVLILEWCELLYFTIVYHYRNTLTAAFILAIIIGLKMYVLLIVYNYSRELSETQEAHHAEHTEDEL